MTGYEGETGTPISYVFIKYNKESVKLRNFFTFSK